MENKLAGAPGGVISTKTWDFSKPCTSHGFPEDMCQELCEGTS